MNVKKSWVGQGQRDFSAAELLRGFGHECGQGENVAGGFPFCPIHGHYLLFHGAYLEIVSPGLENPGVKLTVPVHGFPKKFPWMETSPSSGEGGKL